MNFFLLQLFLLYFDIYVKVFLLFSLFIDIDGYSSENKVDWLLSDCLRLERTVCRSETSLDVDAGKILNCN